MLIGGVRHIFADVLSVPDIAAPLSPFWPVYREPVVVDVIYYDAVLWNFGLLAAAVALHLALAYHDRYPIDTRYRIGERETDGSEDESDVLVADD